jgi:hypothetical protein
LGLGLDFEVQLGSDFGLRAQKLDFGEVSGPGIGLCLGLDLDFARFLARAWERAGTRRHLRTMHSYEGRRGAIAGTRADEADKGTRTRRIGPLKAQVL